MKPVTASAFTQARYNLKHTAFIELKNKAVVEPMYEGEYKTFKGHRLLAIDGSKIMLPNTEAICEHFGTLKWKNPNIVASDEYPCGISSVLYDVLNRIPIDAVIAPAKTYEVDLAIQHITSNVGKNDLVVMDRGYCSYRMLIETQNNNIDCVIRCTKQSFSCAKAMFSGSDEDSKVVKITAGKKQQAYIEENNLPPEMMVRFVRVLLPTGEYEVLATTLTDEVMYPTEIFKELYHCRWGIETFYNDLKNHLSLENFTGNCIEAVYQDFHSSIYLAGIESILSIPAQEKLDKKCNKNPQYVNKTITFHAIKNKAFDLLFHKKQNYDTLLEQMTELFMLSPNLKRSDREHYRYETTPSVSLAYNKRQRKMVF